PESEVASTSRSNVTATKRRRRSRKNKKSSKPKEQSHDFHPRNKASNHHSHANHASSNVTYQNARNGRRNSKENGTKKGSHPKSYAHKPRFAKNIFSNNNLHKTHSHVPHALFNFHDCEHVAYG